MEPQTQEDFTEAINTLLQKAQQKLSDNSFEEMCNDIEMEINDLRPED